MTFMWPFSVSALLISALPLSSSTGHHIMSAVENRIHALCSITHGRAPDIAVAAGLCKMISTTILAADDDNEVSETKRFLMECHSSCGTVPWGGVKVMSGPERQPLRNRDPAATRLTHTRPGRFNTRYGLHGVQQAAQAGCGACHASISSIVCTSSSASARVTHSGSRWCFCQ